MNQDEELHAALLAKFREYFEENQRWLSEGTRSSARRLRKRLSEIRSICSDRRVVVREWMLEKDKELAKIDAERKAQNQQARKDDDAN